jgi:hypothetical protein
MTDLNATTKTWIAHALAAWTRDRISPGAPEPDPDPHAIMVLLDRYSLEDALRWLAGWAFRLNQQISVSGNLKFDYYPLRFPREAALLREKLESLALARLTPGTPLDGEFLWRGRGVVRDEQIHLEDFLPAKTIAAVQPPELPPHLERKASKRIQESVHPDGFAYGWKSISAAYELLVPTVGLSERNIRRTLESLGVQIEHDPHREGGTGVRVQWTALVSAATQRLGHTPVIDGE